MKANNFSLFIIHCSFVIALAITSVSCYNAPQHIILDGAEPADSTIAQFSRPYGIGYNLRVHADSLLLVEDRPMHWSEGAVKSSDSLWIHRNDAIVIAALTVIPEDSVDSVWAKVARDQFTMGWLHESDLLQASCPDDPISQFIYFFSDGHVLWFLAVTGIALIIVVIHILRRQRFRMLLLDDIPSIYPTILASTLALSALLYAFIQQDIPQQWVQFFYHPTLNPFSQPPLLCAFLCTTWALLLLSITVVDDTLKLLPTPEALLYLFSLLAICMVIYLVLSLLPALLALPVGLAFIALAFYRYWTRARARYLCGRCHRKIHHKGPCPYCGAINE